jgi:nitroreductase
MTNISHATLIEQLKWRYATKAFDPNAKIPAEIWTALEDALVLTPSSFGLQPWKFLVITNPELRAKLVPHAWGQAQIADASHLVVLCAPTKIDVPFIDAYLQDMATKRGIPLSALDQLRGMMVGFVEGMTDAQIASWAAKQSYIALGNFMTSAALLGVDTCPMEGFLPDQFDEILDLPAQGLHSIVCCPAGYRSAEDKYASFAKVRWAKEQVIEHR